MRRLLTGCAVRFNRRHRRWGHLLQNRCKSILVEEDSYLLELVRYIHLNPLRVGMVNGLEELDHYPWTGHSTLKPEASSVTWRFESEDWGRRGSADCFTYRGRAF